MTQEKTELVSITVKIPKATLDFYKALLRFTRSDEPLGEFLGDQIQAALEGDFNSDGLETLLNPDKIREKYGLLKR